MMSAVIRRRRGGIANEVIGTVLRHHARSTHASGALVFTIANPPVAWAIVRGSPASRCYSRDRSQARGSAVYTATLLR